MKSVLCVFMATFVLSACTVNKCSEYGCLVVNEVKLSFEEAESLIHECDKFMHRGLGRTVLQSSYVEIAERTGNNPSDPLMMAHLAYSSLYESPLSFTRTHAKDVNYLEIASSCNQLKRDFYGDDSWVR